MAKLKLKSKFEYDVAKWLRSVKQKVRYEEIRIKYAVMRHRYYKPDFILNNGIIIEAKKIPLISSVLLGNSPVKFDTLLKTYH